MGEKWICSCGAECDGNFCTKCGSPRPVIPEPAAEPAAPEVIQEAAPVIPDPAVEEAVPEAAAEEPAAEETVSEPAAPEVIQEAAPVIPDPVVEEAAPEAAAEEPAAPEVIQEAAPVISDPVVEEAAPEAAAEEPKARLAPGQWTCPNCGAIVSGRFCNKCGTPMPEGGAGAVQMAAAGGAAGAASIAASAPAQPKPKKKTGLMIGLIAGGVVLIAAIVVCLILFVLPGGYKTNKVPTETGKEVPEGYKLLVDENQDLSLLYTKNESVEITDDEGSFVYLDNDGDTKYIHIRKYDGKTTPSKYFKAVAEELKNIDPDLDLTDVKEVTAGDKTLYMVSTLTESDSVEQLFLELYDNFYITYSTLGIEEGANNALYNTITTLIPSAQGYAVPETPEPVEYENEMGNFSVVVPGGLEVNEFKSGLYGASDEMGVFAAYLNSDTINGTIIYDHYDFAAQSQRVENYVAQILGVKAVDIGEGKLEKINGTEFSVYPASMTLLDGSTGEGEIYVADADPLGIYLLYYYDQGKSNESAGEEFAHSMKILGKPNISEYTVFFAGEHGIGKLAIKTDLIGKDELADSALAIESPDKKSTVVIEFLESETIDKLVSKQIEDLKKTYDIDAEAVEAELPEEGRYYFDAYEIKYDAKGTPRTFFVAGTPDSEGNLAAVIFDVDDSDLEWANEVVDNVIWSWALD